MVLIELSEDLLGYCKKHISSKYQYEMQKAVKSRNKLKANKFFNYHKELSDEFYRLGINQGVRRAGVRRVE